jgi:hypothetical protein
VTSSLVAQPCLLCGGTSYETRIARRLLHGVGRVEVALAGRTRLAPSIYVVAGRASEKDSG